MEELSIVVFLKCSMLTQAAAEAQAIDDRLSNRFIELDPAGYFLIYLDRVALDICADHYSNTINDKGLACDPETGEPLPCGGKLDRQSVHQFRGKTAKQLCIEIFEKGTCPILRLDHAAYLGREFVRAEIALYADEEYVQD
jgi:dihydropteroate synthase